MALRRAGHCATCEAEIARFVAHGRTGEPILLYTRPDTRYAFRLRPGGVCAIPVGYCPAHAPDPDALLGGARYSHVFTPAFGQYLRAWLGDHAELPEDVIDRVMADWAADCQVAEGVHV